MAAEASRDLFWDKVVYGHGEFTAISARGEASKCWVTVEVFGSVVNTEKESREMRIRVGMDRTRHASTQGLGQRPTSIEIGAYFDFYRRWCKEGRGGDTRELTASRWFLLGASPSHVKWGVKVDVLE